MTDLNAWAQSRSSERSRELLKGAIDLHVHAGPHLLSSPRSVDPVEAAMQARDAGMAAIVFMDVFLMSTGTAWMSIVLRVAVSNVRMPRSHRITFGLPWETMYSADSSSSFSVVLKPRLSKIGRCTRPTSFSNG